MRPRTTQQINLRTCSLRSFPYGELFLARSQAWPALSPCTSLFPRVQRRKNRLHDAKCQRAGAPRRTSLYPPKSISSAESFVNKSSELDDPVVGNNLDVFNVRKVIRIRHWHIRKLDIRNA